MAKRAATKAAAEKAAFKTDVTMTATDNAPKATAKPEAAVAEGVTATDNVPEGAFDTNTDGSVNAYDTDGNKAGNADAETVQKAQEKAAEQLEKEKKAAADEEKKAPEGMATMKAVTRYLDKQLNEIKDAGETYTVSKGRAAELVHAKVAEIIK